MKGTKIVLEYEKIGIDFDVFKKITERRKSAEDTPNDVLRELFGLERESKSIDAGPAWIYKGATLRAGTKLRAHYSGSIHTAEIKDGKIFVNRKACVSPTAAAQAVTGGPRNGWTFWEYENPSTGQWHSIDELRQANS